ncbi:hypothetical protein [Erwinia sp. S38]|uniref:hypothetical protein n=1 Tax=Erwinia sp. S38 TaxID=2769338 RepID=UPI001909D167|nr:hypothetical protein [Erwinia sp. S38]MBK0000202.1 hypothetical protein [Erwinia sp. S38]
MSIKELKIFIDSENKKITEDEVEINWDKQKKDWLDFVNDFYVKIKSWLKPLIDDGSIVVSFSKVNLKEDFIGSYDLEKMVIKVARKEVELVPVGTLLIGTKGRIDMKGLSGKVQFILADKKSSGVKFTVKIHTVNGEVVDSNGDDSAKKNEIEWDWKIVRRGGNKIEFDEFNEDNFISALIEVMGS